MKKVFVSGCFDILHGGHVEFFNQAKSLGDYLIVSFASDEVLWDYKYKKPSMPEEHKLSLISSLRMVDEVVIGDDLDNIGLEFEKHFAESNANILAVTKDDSFSDLKKQLCEKYSAEYVVLDKNLSYKQTSTSNIIKTILAPKEAPLRVDFAGGWLDVPKFAMEDSYIVNCAVKPLVSLQRWGYEQNSGMGGSAAWAYLNGNSSLESELNMGVGWQDPAIIQETGVCVWKSGALPKLELKYNPDWLYGKMALLFTGKHHITKDLVDTKRNWSSISKISKIAKTAVENKCLKTLAEAINKTYDEQLKEGMQELSPVHNSIAKKYCGSGHGGYALYIFNCEKDRNDYLMQPNTIKIDPYIRNIK